MTLYLVSGIIISESHICQNGVEAKAEALSHRQFCKTTLTLQECK